MSYSFSAIKQGDYGKINIILPILRKELEKSVFDEMLFNILSKVDVFETTLLIEHALQNNTEIIKALIPDIKKFEQDKIDRILMHTNWNNDFLFHNLAQYGELKLFKELFKCVSEENRSIILNSQNNLGQTVSDYLSKVSKGFLGEISQLIPKQDQITKNQDFISQIVEYSESGKVDNIIDELDDYSSSKKLNLLLTKKPWNNIIMNLAPCLSETQFKKIMSGLTDEQVFTVLKDVNQFNQTVFSIALSTNNFSFVKYLYENFNNELQFMNQTTNMGDPILVETVSNHNDKIINFLFPEIFLDQNGHIIPEKKLLISELLYECATSVSCPTFLFWLDKVAKYNLAELLLEKSFQGISIINMVSSNCSFFGNLTNLHILKKGLLSINLTEDQKKEVIQQINKSIESVENNQVKKILESLSDSLTNEVFNTIDQVAKTEHSIDGIPLEIEENAIDTYLEEGALRKTLRANPSWRKKFWKKHEKIKHKLMQNSQNPLLEEGDYNGPENRSKEGELFLTMPVIEKMVDLKIRKNEVYKQRYNVNQIGVLNGEEQLKEYLDEIIIDKDNNAKFLYYEDDVHVIAGYIFKQRDKTIVYLQDPEGEEIDEGVLKVIKQKFATSNEESSSLSIIQNSTLIQRDFYSCSIVSLKSLQYFVKHADELQNFLLEYTDDNSHLEEVTLPENDLPIKLLKLSQNSKRKELSDEIKSTIVSTKRNLTLKEYWEHYDLLIRKPKGVSEINASALLKRYKYVRELANKESGENAAYFNDHNKDEEQKPKVQSNKKHNK